MVWRTLMSVPFTGGVQVTAIPEDGLKFEGDLLVGADGV
jgi:2-polyprenyl-6-methoxyphenol hydroxylase-like FAD-dependent oxidoreductase